MEGMQENVLDKIKNNPKYQELVHTRSRFAWTMAIIMLVIYYTFIMIIAFAPGFLGTPISPGSVTTIGIPIGIGVIISAFILTGIYVLRANAQFDRLTNEIKRELL
jgi:uncharacterized membrane protein (DUF485 family)